MKIINLTPHIINEVTTGTSYPLSGTIARVSSESEVVANINGIDIYSVSFGEVEGLPESQPDTIYIVSGLVLSACHNRTDLLAPGELVRDINGNPIGCKGFRK